LSQQGKTGRKAGGVLEVSNPNLRYSSAATGQLPLGARMPDDRGEERERCNGIEVGKDGKGGKGDELEGDELLGR
jgi:hypothetical protein